MTEKKAAGYTERERRSLLNRIEHLRATQGKSIAEGCDAVGISENAYFSWKRKFAAPASPPPATNGAAVASPVATGPGETVPMDVFLEVCQHRDRLREMLFRVLTGKVDSDQLLAELVATQLGMRPPTEPEEDEP